MALNSENAQTLDPPSYQSPGNISTLRIHNNRALGYSQRRGGLAASQFVVSPQTVGWLNLTSIFCFDFESPIGCSF